MTARRSVAAALVVALTTLSAASLSTANVPDPPASLDPAAFAFIAGSDFDAATQQIPQPVASRGPAPAMADFRGADPSRAPRPRPALTVAPKVIVKAKPRPAPTTAPPPAVGGSARASGTATWYCKRGVSICHHAYPGGLYAAAGPALRVGKWRGRVVRVCGSGSCVTVKLVDWCACPGRRVIDLYSDAFRRLAPLSQGTVRVTVSW